MTTNALAQCAPFGQPDASRASPLERQPEPHASLKDGVEVFDPKLDSTMFDKAAAMVTKLGPSYDVYIVSVDPPANGPRYDPISHLPSTDELATRLLDTLP